METRLDELFKAWSTWGGAILVAGTLDTLPSYSLEEMIAESTMYCRTSGRLTWVVLDALIRLIDKVDVEKLLKKTRKNGDFSVLGVLSELASLRRPHIKFAQIVRECKPNQELTPFFHRVAKSPLATRLAQENGLEIFRKWNYLCSELRYLSDNLPFAG